MNLTKRIIEGIELVPGLKHHRFQVDGGPMSVYEAGKREEEKVILLHGAMYDEARFIWDQLFPYLSESYHVFAIDIPRHGRSRPWTGNLNNSRLMDILHTTFKQLDLTSFSLIGISMGGALSIEYASLHPDNVNSMVLFEPGGLGYKLDNHFITWLYIKTPGMLKLLNKKYAKANYMSLEKLLNSIYVKGTKPTAPDRLISILKKEIKRKFNNNENDMDDWQLNIIGPFKLKWNLLDRIPMIKCPTLWLRGDKSILVKQHEMEVAVHLAKLGGANASLKLIENAGHLLPLEQPDKVNLEVKTFLDNILKKTLKG